MRLFQASLFSVLLCCGHRGVVGHTNDGYYSGKGAVADYPDWMKFLPDDALVSDLTLLGTHDTWSWCREGSWCDSNDGRLRAWALGAGAGLVLSSAAFLGPFAIIVIPALAVAAPYIIEDLARTQSMTLGEQLQSGIRHIDIRINYEKTSTKTSHFTHENCAATDDPSDCFFPIYHGFFYQGVNFEEHVLDVLVKFLDDNPTETVIMLMAEEGPDKAGLTGRSKNPALPQALNNVISSAKYKDYFLNRTLCSSFGPPFDGIVLGNRTNECHARKKIQMYIWNGEEDGLCDINPADEAFTWMDFCLWSWGAQHQQGSPPNIIFHNNWSLYPFWTTTRDYIKSIYKGWEPGETPVGDGSIFIGLNANTVGFPYFFASGHSDPTTGANRLLTGWVTSYATWPFSGESCATRSKYPDFPCVGIVCLPLVGCLASVAFEGMNTLVKDLLEKNRGKQVGVIAADFPGAGLIRAAIEANINAIGDALDIGLLSSNTPPVAKLDKEQYVIDEGSVVAFDASGSSDAQIANDQLGFTFTVIPSTCVREASDTSLTSSYYEALAAFLKENVGLDANSAIIAFLETDEGKKLFKETTDTPDNLAVAHFYCPDDTTGDTPGIVSVFVRDDFDEVVATALLIINNVAPTVTVTGTEIDENGEATIMITVEDPGVLDDFIMEIDWGDETLVAITTLGSSSTGSQTIAATHHYLDDDPTASLQDSYLVQVKVTDKDDGVGEAGTRVIVNNVAPAISLDAVSNELRETIRFGGDIVYGLVGLQISIAVSFSDVGTKDTQELVFDWGSTTTDTFTNLTTSLSSPFEAKHVFHAPADYAVTVTVTDDDGGLAFIRETLKVVNSCGGLRILATSVQDLATKMAADQGTPGKTVKELTKVFKELNQIKGNEREAWEKKKSKKMAKMASSKIATWDGCTAVSSSIKKVADAMKDLEHAMKHLEHAMKQLEHATYSSEMDLIRSQHVLIAKAMVVQVYNDFVPGPSKSSTRAMDAYSKLLEAADAFLGLSEENDRIAVNMYRKALKLKGLPVHGRETENRKEKGNGK